MCVSDMLLYSFACNHGLTISNGRRLWCSERVLGVHGDIIDCCSIAQGFTQAPEDLLQLLVIQYHTTNWCPSPSDHKVNGCVTESWRWFLQLPAPCTLTACWWMDCASTSLVRSLKCSFSSRSRADNYGSIRTKQPRQASSCALKTPQALCCTSCLILTLFGAAGCGQQTPNPKLSVLLELRPGSRLYDISQVVLPCCSF